MTERVSASRAPNGSSISKRRGLMASTLAIAARWRMPPDNSAGRRARNGSSPVRRSMRS